MGARSGRQHRRDQPGLPRRGRALKGAVRAIPPVRRADPPILRADPQAERRVSWLELTFDLVFVVCITELSEDFRADLTVARALAVAGLYTLVFLTWADTMRTLNQLVGDGPLRRTLTLVQIQAFAVAAWLLRDDASESLRGFAAALLVARVAVVVEYARALRHLPADRDALLVELSGAGLGALALATGAIFASPVWLALAAASSLVGPLGRSARHVLQLPMHAAHQSERYALFLLIVIGDALAEAIDALGEHPVAAPAGVVIAVGLCISACLWWAYYDGVDDRRLRTDGHWPAGWLGVHLLIALGTTLFGAAIYRLLVLGLLDAPDPGDAAVLGAGTGLAWGGLALLNLLAEPRQPVAARRQLAAVGVAMLVVAIGPAVHVVWVLALAAGGALLAAHGRAARPPPRPARVR